MKSRTWMVIAAVVAGCGGGTSQAITLRPNARANVEAGPPAASVVSTAPALEPPAATLATLSADLDGDGVSEDISFLSDGSLHVGSATTYVRIANIDELAQPELLDQREVLAQIDLNALDSQSELLLRIAVGAEDPPSQYWVFGYGSGVLTQLFDVESGTLSFPGDSTIVKDEDAYEACASHRTIRDRIVYRARPASATFAEHSRRHFGSRINCAELPACPYVYVIDAVGTSTLAGEILRNLRRESLYATQTLTLGMIPSGQHSLHVRVAEQRPESTYLDSVGLRVGDRLIKPDACRGVDVPAYCVQDQQMQILREGDTLELTFTLDGNAASSPSLEASGYYLPERPSPR